MTQTSEHPKPKHHGRVHRRERGLPLTIWIAVIGIFGVYTAIVQGLLQASALGLASSAFLFVLAWGLWKWQRWAYFTLLVVFAIAAAVVLIAVISGGTSVVLLAIVLAAAAATVAIVQPRLGEFR